MCDLKCLRNSIISSSLHCFLPQGPRTITARPDYSTGFPVHCSFSTCWASACSLPACLPHHTPCRQARRPHPVQVYSPPHSLSSSPNPWVFLWFWIPLKLETVPSHLSMSNSELLCHLLSSLQWTCNFVFYKVVELGTVVDWFGFTLFQDDPWEVTTKPTIPPSDVCFLP